MQVSGFGLPGVIPHPCHLPTCAGSQVLLGEEGSCWILHWHVIYTSRFQICTFLSLALHMAFTFSLHVLYVGVWMCVSVYVCVRVTPTDSLSFFSFFIFPCYTHTAVPIACVISLKHNGLLWECFLRLSCVSSSKHNYPYSLPLLVLLSVLIMGQIVLFSFPHLEQISPLETRNLLWA